MDPHKKVLLQGAFTHLMNSESVDNDLNTPDFILGEYLVDCLETFEKAHGNIRIYEGRAVPQFVVPPGAPISDGTFRETVTPTDPIPRDWIKDARTSLGLDGDGN